ncbi:MAG: ATP-binding cassette domain-containing protein [Oligoflexia bacterium]|nr:ATP-binding cassette domain-containing protein [Oligoflexia bacterium]
MYLNNGRGPRDLNSNSLVHTNNIKRNTKNTNFYSKDDQNYSINYIYHLEDVSVQFAKNKILKSISFTINPQDKIFLIGPSGAGKTTFLKLLRGIVRPTEGRILRSSNSHNQSKISNSNYLCNPLNFASLIFQDFRLINDWSLEDNLWISYDPQIYKSKDEFNDDLINLSKLFTIKDKLDFKVSACNEGIKQKTAIIRSLLSKPQVILADEPTSALDNTNTERLYEILTFYNEKNGITFVWASHNKDLIKNFSGKIIQVDNGRLTYMGHSCFT